jgi:hypothetical protein
LSVHWSISPTMLNHLGFGYNRFRNANQTNSLFADKNWAQELGFHQRAELPGRLHLLEIL